MKKIAIVLSFVLLCTGAVIAGENHGSCDMNKAHHAKATDMTGKIFTKDHTRYFQAADSDKAYPICSHSTASLDKLDDNSDVRAKASIINCDDDGKEEVFIEKAKKI